MKSTAPQHGSSRRRNRRIRRGWLTLAVAALVTAGVAEAVQQSDDEPAASGYREVDLRRDIDALRALGITGIQARVTTASGRDLVATTGVAETGTNSPVAADGYFRIASTGKALMATVILQLVDQGKLALDDTVDRWLPGLIDGNGNDGREITVRQLLQNTSGLHDDLPGFDSAAEYYEHRYDTYTAEQIVQRSMKHRPDFQPGTGWSYSNTGYVVAGMIAEKASARPWQKTIASQILKPLDLNHTYLSGSTPALRNPHARGYQVFASGEQTDVTEQIVPDLGGYVSTTRDINRFFQGLLGGELVSAAGLAEMRDTVAIDRQLEAIWPGGRYGLGLVNRPLTCGGTYWSHQGGEAGYITLNGATDEGTRTVTLSMTTSFNDPDRTLRQQQLASDLVDRALCDTSGS
ncbi:serine hydrolase domain-containing protein [Nocardia ninae]|uniref:D-alanyl-D-alanine carboxypeptidase n=1 Tax=Nocardia ninae NBRC 108245 TaxID=1210091 RepID=A0A511MCG0_9NOCA|nr:serine hydrolase domain-containing protein [Nocardia ninae]GEM38355.1 D-alanyl-D-alanine carboxypeptidase [Nocardia ninae NBRC 108245]